MEHYFGGGWFGAVAALAVGAIFLFMVILAIFMPYFVWKIQEDVRHVEQMVDRLYPRIISCIAAVELIASSIPDQSPSHHQESSAPPAPNPEQTKSPSPADEPVDTATLAGSGPEV
ncbi:MAG: hypothetical protein OEV73_00300 [Desulfobulbaceae bacterium]|nr:hypothetical protein [Desulfobulbaceae bacterium]